jgi:hypothetical protein
MKPPVSDGTAQMTGPFRPVDRSVSVGVRPFGFEISIYGFGSADLANVGLLPLPIDKTSPLNRK